MEVNPWPKSETERNPKYLKFIRTKYCAKCHEPPPNMAHHEGKPGDGGIGLKCSDYRTLPLCPSCHRTRHNIGRLTFWGEKDFEWLIGVYNKMWGKNEKNNQATEKEETRGS